MSVLSTEVALSGATRSRVAHAPMYPGRVLQSTLTLLQPLEVGGQWPLHLGDSSRSPGPFGTFRKLSLSVNFHLEKMGLCILVGKGSPVQMHA